MTAAAGETSGAAGDRLLAKLATFGRILREMGLEVGANRLQDALEGLTAIDLTSRDESYWVLRCTLISRRDHVEAFDAAFAAFWERALGAAREEHLPREEAGPAAGDAAVAAAPADRNLGGSADATDEEVGNGEAGMAWSAVERLRRLDFAEYTDEEMRRARQLVERVARARPMRRSRRLRSAAYGDTLDKRRMLRSAMRTEGYPLVRLCRRRRLVPRKVVFLIDISGSMEPYARAMVMFLHAAVGPGRKVEAFTFATRLTRITRELEGHEPDLALKAAARAVPDWAGGTRIGDNVKALNDDWGRRGVTRGAVVVIVSDGWERGEVDLLSREMARLRRATHTIVWLNPLAAEPGYEPLAQGMAAALPHVDRFLPVRDLRSLEVLADVLASLSDGSRRRQ